MKYILNSSRESRVLEGCSWRLSFFFVFFLLSIGPLSVSQGVAQDYPTRALRIIVPFPPGGGNDILARRLAQVLTPALAKPVIVDNKPGASSIIGTEFVAKAPPDGYTILMGNNGALTINPSMFPELQYDPVKDFAPITLLGSAPLAWLVHPSVPARSVQELIALAKTRPGQLNFGSAGIGIVTHLAPEMLKSMARIELTAIPYKSAGGVISDLISGQIDMLFTSMIVALPAVRSGRVRIIAFTSAERSSVLPDVPTIAESGFPGYEATVWYAILAPARTHQEVIKRLNVEFVKALNNPKVRESLVVDGAQVIGSSPEALSAVIRSDLAKWARVIKEAGLARNKGGDS